MSEQPDTPLENESTGIETPADEPIFDLSSTDLASLDPQFDALIALETEGLSVDEALAAVASLNELVAPPETAQDDVEIGAEPEAAPVETLPYQSTIAAPPMITLQRGQMASVLPALLLIALGAWLTFTLTTSDSGVSTSIVITIAIAGLGATLIGHWLSSGRWSQGALLLGSDLVLSAGVFWLLSGSSGLGLARGWPLFIAALGAAFILTAFLSLTAARRGLGIGLLVMTAGLSGLAVTAGVLASSIVSAAGRLWPILLILLLVIWLLPVFFRRRSSRESSPSEAAPSIPES